MHKQTTDIGTHNICADTDGDGYSPPDDCVEGNPAIYPGGTEVCDGKDNNCNYITDEGCTICTDNDGDGYNAQTGCGTLIDCDDSDVAINPLANESCDGVDNNCDGLVDESGANQTNYYPDADEDGYGSNNGAVLACNPPSGGGLIYLSSTGDCNDGDFSINPGAPEMCGDEIDNNCDGQIDEDCACDLSISSISPNEVCMLNQNELTVYGANFTADTKVIVFREHPTQFVNTGELFTGIPAWDEAGIYDVFVINPTSCQAILPGALQLSDATSAVCSGP
jgi:hypothetical protein